MSAVLHEGREAAQASSTSDQHTDAGKIHTIVRVLESIARVRGDEFNDAAFLARLTPLRKPVPSALFRSKSYSNASVENIVKMNPFKKTPSPQAKAPPTDTPVPAQLYAEDEQVGGALRFHIDQSNATWKLPEVDQSAQQPIVWQQPLLAAPAPLNLTDNFPKSPKKSPHGSPSKVAFSFAKPTAKLSFVNQKKSGASPQAKPTFSFAKKPVSTVATVTDASEESDDDE